MLQHGPPKKKEPDWRVDRGSDGSRWFIAVVHSFVWIKLEAWISAPNGRYIQQWNQWDKLQKKHVVIGKIQGSLRTLNRLSDYPCVYIYIWDPQLNTAQLPINRWVWWKNLHSQDVSSQVLDWIPILGWVKCSLLFGQNTCLLCIIVSQPQKTMVKDGQGRKVRLSKLIAQHDSPDM